MPKSHENATSNSAPRRDSGRRAKNFRERQDKRRNDEFNEVIERLWHEGWSPHAVQQYIREQGGRIARATVVSRMRELKDARDRRQGHTGAASAAPPEGPRGESPVAVSEVSLESRVRQLETALRQVAAILSEALK